MLYKSILSKLNAAKELMAEFVTREKKKQAERDAAKAAKAAKVRKAARSLLPSFVNDMCFCLPASFACYARSVVCSHMSSSLL